MELGRRLAAADFQIVDCRLPPRIRRLGTERVYPAPQRPVRTTGRDCGIRGGDAVVFDPSNYATALALWLPLAEEGDPKAQTYVGDIYERGLTGSPDYKTAAEWYRRAADQGYASAQVSLGQLYERGLGVPPDRAKAMNLYRQASGLEEPLEVVAAGEVQGLRAQVGEGDRQAQELTAQVERLQRDLEAARAEQRTLQAERASLERSRQALLEQRDVNAADREADEVASFERVQQQLQELERREAELASREDMLAQKEQEISDLRSQTREGDHQAQALNAGIERLTEELQLARAEQPGLQAERESLERSRQALLEQGEALDNSSARVQRQLQDIDRRAAELAAREREVVLRENALAQREEEIRQLIGSLSFGDYYALVIGNEIYQNGMDVLPSATNDADVISKTLQNRYGFQVILLPNATRKEILDALNTLKDELTHEDNLLVYYAGHGKLEGSQGYWIPVDAEPEPYTTNWIPTDNVVHILNSMKAKQVIVIADSCYSGAFAEAQPQILGWLPYKEEYINWLKTVAKQPARMALTSGDLEPVLSGGSEAHSIFASALIEELGTNTAVMEGWRLYLHLAARLADAERTAGVKQKPTYRVIQSERHRGGDFFFVPEESATL